jgi:hypothetical protein
MFKEIPNELIGYICDYLPDKELINIGLLNSDFFLHSFCNNQYIWVKRPQRDKIKLSDHDLSKLKNNYREAYRLHTILQKPSKLIFYKAMQYHDSKISKLDYKKEHNQDTKDQIFCRALQLHKNLSNYYIEQFISFVTKMLCHLAYNLIQAHNTYAEENSEKPSLDLLKNKKYYRYFKSYINNYMSRRKYNRSTIDFMSCCLYLINCEQKVAYKLITEKFKSIVLVKNAMHTIQETEKILEEYESYDVSGMCNIL